MGVAPSQGCKLVLPQHLDSRSSGPVTGGVEGLCGKIPAHSVAKLTFTRAGPWLQGKRSFLKGERTPNLLLSNEGHHLYLARGRL